MRFPFRRSGGTVPPYTGPDPVVPVAPQVRLEDELAALPPAPRNVRVQVGEVIYPVELSYQGTDTKGVARWHATANVHVPPGAHGVVICDELPAGTELTVGLG